MDKTQCIFHRFQLIKVSESGISSLYRLVVDLGLVEIIQIVRIGNKGIILSSLSLIEPLNIHPVIQLGRKIFHGLAVDPFLDMVSFLAVQVFHPLLGNVKIIFAEHAANGWMRLCILAAAE